MNIEIVKTVDDKWIVLIDGFQHGGKYDKSGAGDKVFNTFEEAKEYTNSL